MDKKPGQAFDFHGQGGLSDVFNTQTNNTFKKLQLQGLRPDKIQDLFYDALEEEGVDGSLKGEVADAFQPGIADRARTFIKKFIADGGIPNIYKDPLRLMEKNYLATAQNIAQHAIRLSKIKGAVADPLLREIAREVSALPETQHESCAAMMAAMTTAFERMHNPPPPPPKPKRFIF